MHYCPYCSAKLHKKVDVCPECKKVIDYKLLGNLFDEEESSHVNRKAARKIWLKERALIIFPVIALLIGLVAGAILMFGYLQIAFQNERSDYETSIADLNNVISQKNSAAQASTQQFQDSLVVKDQIISILAEQLDIMGRAVNFTNRLSRNCTITPNSIQEADFYRRNILYLNNQFNLQVEALKEIPYEPRRTYSVITIPEVME
jgi:hypothetical protein